MRCLTLAELLMLESVILMLLAYLNSMFVPEVRRVLGLEPQQPTSPFAAKVFKAASLLLILLGILFLVSFFLCHTRADATHAAEPSIPDGPIKEGGSVEVDGAKFTLYTFLQGYHWKYGQVEVQFNQQQITGEEMMGYLARLKETISLGEAVICVGTASQDIQKDESFEEQRADTRANQMAIWIGPAVSQANQMRPRANPVEIYRLNLGHYRDVPDKDDQRMIIFVRVQKVDPKVSLDELLSPANRETLERKLKEKGFPFSFDSYSLFELIKHT
jgi:hypothetical protein